jgi:pentatricopeptide repeat domain-containing protein 1
MTKAGVRPDVITYNALISAYEKGGQWERARAAFEEMVAAGVQPNIITYNALISAYEQGRQWERARAAFEEMVAAGVQPNVVTYSALISAYERGGQWERARATFEKMVAVGVQPDVQTYNPLLSMLWKCDQQRTTIELYTKASAMGLYSSQAKSKFNKIDLHDMSAGAALAATTLWLEAIITTALERHMILPESFTTHDGRFQGEGFRDELRAGGAVRSIQGSEEQRRSVGGGPDRCMCMAGRPGSCG